MNPPSGDEAESTADQNRHQRALVDLSRNGSGRATTRIDDVPCRFARLRASLLCSFIPSAQHYVRSVVVHHFPPSNVLLLDRAMTARLFGGSEWNAANATVHEPPDQEDDEDQPEKAADPDGSASTVIAATVYPNPPPKSTKSSTIIRIGPLGLPFVKFVGNPCRIGTAKFATKPIEMAVISGRVQRQQGKQ